MLRRMPRSRRARQGEDEAFAVGRPSIPPRRNRDRGRAHRQLALNKDVLAGSFADCLFDLGAGDGRVHDEFLYLKNPQISKRLLRASNCSLVGSNVCAPRLWCTSIASSSGTRSATMSLISSVTSRLDALGRRWRLTLNTGTELDSPRVTARGQSQRRGSPLRSTAGTLRSCCHRYGFPTARRTQAGRRLHTERRPSRGPLRRQRNPHQPPLPGDRRRVDADR